MARDNGQPLGSTGQIPGSASNDSAAAGRIGEYISSSVAVGSAVSLTSNTGANITSISLTAGDWDVEGNLVFDGAGGARPTVITGAVNAASATLPTAPGSGSVSRIEATLATDARQILPVTARRVSIASTTTYYLVAAAVFASGTMVGYGFIGARRAR